MYPVRAIQGRTVGAGTGRNCSASYGFVYFAYSLTNGHKMKMENSIHPYAAVWVRSHARDTPFQVYRMGNSVLSITDPIVTLMWL